MLVLVNALNGGPAFAASKGVVVSHVSVTNAKLKGESAVLMSIDNKTKGPISLLSVTSPESRMSMIYFDDNMCQGNSKMTWISNILITPGRTQKLALRYQGAMLSELKEPLIKGQTVPLTVTWSNYRSVHTLTVNAKIVSSPKGLHFLMSPMKM